MIKVFDGKKTAMEIRCEIRAKTEELKARKGIFPRLDVILIGNDPASAIYVRNKEKACVEAGIKENTHKYEFLEEKEIIKLINKLNSDPEVDGILVQLPLPKQINTTNVINSISAAKDVDGLSVDNMGRLLKGEKPQFLPCTPRGIMHLLLSTGVDIKGKQAVVIGRSNIVGKPIALMLLEKHATVTICHSRTVNLGAVCAGADILVAAVGKAKMVQGDWIKNGAMVIDVGMNRVGEKWVGDVDYDEAVKKASYITPVPGGVGPMTIAMLLQNTLESAERRAS